MVHPYRQDQRQGLWTRFGDTKSYTTCLALDGRMKILFNRVYLKSRSGDIKLCLRRKCQWGFRTTILWACEAEKHTCEPAQGVRRGWNSHRDNCYRQNLQQLRVLRLWVLRLGPASKQSGSGRSWIRPLDWCISQRQTTMVLLLGVARTWNTSICDYCATND